MRARFVVDGRQVEIEAEPRLLLSDALRHRAGAKGVHVGCEHGVCGCCTVLLDGVPVRSCLMLAVQADGSEIVTAEGLLEEDGSLHAVQRAFREAHGLQCGFCTPGFVVSVTAFLREHDGAELTDDEIREALAGNLCRCTGYANIVDAVRIAAREMAR